MCVVAICPDYPESIIYCSRGSETPGGNRAFLNASILCVWSIDSFFSGIQFQLHEIELFSRRVSDSPYLAWHDRLLQDECVLQEGRAACFSTSRGDFLLPLLSHHCDTYDFYKKFKNALDYFLNGHCKTDSNAVLGSSVAQTVRFMAAFFKKGVWTE